MKPSSDLEFVLKPGVRLDLETADRFRAQTYAFLAVDAARAIVDFSETEEMDVAGLAALVHLLVLARERQLQVVLAGPISGPVMRLIDYSGFGPRFTAA